MGRLMELRHWRPQVRSAGLDMFRESLLKVGKLTNSVASCSKFSEEAPDPQSRRAKPDSLGIPAELRAGST